MKSASDLWVARSQLYVGQQVFKLHSWAGIRSNNGWRQWDTSGRSGSLVTIGTRQILLMAVELETSMHLKKHTWPSPITSCAMLLCILVGRNLTSSFHFTTMPLHSVFTNSVKCCLCPSSPPQAPLAHLLRPSHASSTLLWPYSATDPRHGSPGVGFVPLTSDLTLTSCRFRSHSVDFGSLRSPQYHLVSCASGVKDLEEHTLSFPWSEIPHLPSGQL